MVHHEKLVITESQNSMPFIKPKGLLSYAQKYVSQVYPDCFPTFNYDKFLSACDNVDNVK